MSPEIVLGTAFILFFVFVAVILTIKSLIVIVPPNMAAVLTGRNRRLPSGETIGYRSVIGGRTLRVPIIETVQYCTLETFPIEISVTNAFSRGNIPLNIEAIASVLSAAGGSLGDVVMNHIFITDYANYAAMNEVYARYFGETRPARYCVKAELVNPDWLVEIASVAVLGG